MFSPMVFSGGTSLPETGSCAAPAAKLRKVVPPPVAMGSRAQLLTEAFPYIKPTYAQGIIAGWDADSERLMFRLDPGQVSAAAPDSNPSFPDDPTGDGCVWTSAMWVVPTMSIWDLFPGGLHHDECIPCTPPSVVGTAVAAAAAQYAAAVETAAEAILGFSSFVDDAPIAAR